MKIRGLFLSAIAALLVAAALAGCGTTNYYAGRTLPPSGISNRVLIAIQNTSSLTKGTLQFVDAYYDVRYSYNGSTTSFTISGFSGALPITIQNMPEEQLGAVYGSGDGTFSLISYSSEKLDSTVSGLPGLSSSIFTTRDKAYVFAASQASNVFTVIDNGSPIYLSLPGVYRTSVNTGASVALAFVQNSNYMYYPVKLTDAQRTAFYGGSSHWPKAAVDCEPQNAPPTWCLFQAQSPDNYDSATGTYSGSPLTFDRPVKAVFSADGSTAYILNCGPECGGTQASISVLSVAPMIYTAGHQSGALPKTGTISTILIPGGSTNARVSGSTLYVTGQCLAATSLSSGSPQCAGSTLTSSGKFTGMLTIVNLSTKAVSKGPISISDGEPNGDTRIALGDDNTLWIANAKCTNGARAANSLNDGCLTMFNLSSNTVTKIFPWIGDATGVAPVDGLHKVYVAEGGQIYIIRTTDGAMLDNQYVTVNGTAYDVAYMDSTTDANNTVY